MQGKVLTPSTSHLLSGPLGVVYIYFDGLDLGKTTADCNLSPEQDIKDIMYQQDGTKAADHVRTGMDVMLSATFGEINTELLSAMMSGITSKSPDSMTMGRSIYQSMRATEAKTLKVVSSDENGKASEELKDQMNFYEAIPIVSGELINWGADTQRNFPVDFRIKYHFFPEGTTSPHVGAFGYMGDPGVEEVPAIDWPDVMAPQLVSAIAERDTEIDVTFSKDLAFQSNFKAAHYTAEVAGAFVAPTAGVIVGEKIGLTFPANTFAAGQRIQLSISYAALQDNAIPPHTIDSISGYEVENRVP